MIFVVHAAILLACAHAAARRLAADRLRRLLATFVIAWAVLVATGEGLSIFGKLGSLPFHAALSIALAGAVAVVARRFTPVDAPGEPLESDPRRRWTRPLFTIAAIAAVLTAFISLSFHPNNPDAVQAYLPRVVFARDQGHLGAVPSGDFRMSFTPTNGTVVDVYLLLYTKSDLLFPMLNLAAWIVLLVGVTALAREAGAGPVPAWLSGFAAALAGSPLMQAGSTNLDLVATAPLIAALAFAGTWIHTGAARFALLAGLAMGLSIGTKPSVYFFAPAAALAGALWLWAVARRAIVPHLSRAAVAGHAALFLFGALAFGSSWIVRNLRDEGRLSPRHEDLDAGRWMQEGFSAGRMARGTALHFTQQALQPVAALWPDMRRGEAALRGALKPEAWLPVKAPPGARFDFDFTFAPICEDTAWFGFGGVLVWLPAVVYGLLLRRHRSIVLFLLAAAALVWILFYYGMTNWYPHNGRYTLMPFAVGCAAIGLGLMRLRPAATTAVAVVLLFSSTLETAQATIRNNRRNVRRAFANLRAGERRHFLSRDNENILRDLPALAEGLDEVVFFNRGAYGRPYATMTTLGLERRYRWQAWTDAPSAGALVALPYQFTLLYTPSRDGLATGFVLPALEEGTAYFALPPDRAARLRNAFVWLAVGANPEQAAVSAIGLASGLRYRVAGVEAWSSASCSAWERPSTPVAIEFDEDGDGAPDARVVVPAARMTFDGGYPSPVSLDLNLARLRSKPTLDAWLARGRPLASDAPFDFKVLARREGESDWRIVAAAEGVTACEPASMVGDYAGLGPGAWAVCFGVARADSPNRTLDVPNSFDDYVVFDVRLTN